MREPLPTEWFDPNRHDVIVGGERRHLRPTEWRLFELLWSRAPSPVSARAAMDFLYEDRTNPPFDNIIKTFICDLRRALIGTPWRIEREYSIGWILADGPADERQKATLWRQRNR